MHIEIFHANETLFSKALFYRKNGEIFDAAAARAAFEASMATESIQPRDYIAVATIDAASDDPMGALEDAYARSQNLDRAWRAPPCRSTSVGDIMRIGDDLYIVASYGFEQI